MYGLSGAMSRDQAALVFNLASKMVQLSPKLGAIVRIVPSGKRLLGLNLNTEYRALAADGKTAHGLSPILAILDETGQVRGPQSDFIDAIVTSQGAHEAPLLIVIAVCCVLKEQQIQKVANSSARYIFKQMTMESRLNTALNICASGLCRLIVKRSQTREKNVRTGNINDSCG